MSQRLFMVVSGLLLLTLLLWQRSSHTHYSYTRSELEKEKVLLGKQVKTLKMEINQLATPAVLYSYWKENEENLEFIQTELVAEKKKEDPKGKKKSKSQMASFRGRSF